jgi:hypothetical protein
MTGEQRSLRVRWSAGTVTVYDGLDRIYEIDGEGETSAASDYRGGFSEEQARAAIREVAARRGESMTLRAIVRILDELYGAPEGGSS